MEQRVEVRPAASRAEQPAGAPLARNLPVAPPEPEAPGVHTARLLERGRRCEQQHDYAGARAAYVMAAEAGELRGAFYLGRLYRKQDSVAEALAAYRQALEAPDELLVAWSAYDLGGIMERLRRFDEAADYYRRASERGDIDPGPAAARRLDALRLSGRVRDAR
jgi:tetratricopeptide (TPR) repeat protein